MKIVCHMEKHEMWSFCFQRSFNALWVWNILFLFSLLVGWFVCLDFFIFHEFQRPYPKGFSNLMQHSWVHNFNWRFRSLQWNILILTEKGGSEGRGRTGCPSCVLCCLEWCSCLSCVGEGKQSDMQTEMPCIFLKVKSFIPTARSQWGLV